MTTWEVVLGCAGSVQVAPSSSVKSYLGVENTVPGADKSLDKAVFPLSSLGNMLFSFFPQNNQVLARSERDMGLHVH